MSFSREFDASDARPAGLVQRFAALLQPVSDAALASLAAESRRITRQNFGRTMRLFAPLYLSNECINNCRYCGFSRDNPILRVTLTIDQVVAEARHLVAQGFRNILLVAGEHPRFVSEGYLEDCIRALREFVPSLSIEVGPMERPEYERMMVQVNPHSAPRFRVRGALSGLPEFATAFSCPAGSPMLAKNACSVW